MLKFLSSMRTSIKFAPKGSQVVILFLTLIFGFCLMIGFFFIWNNVDYWLPFVCAALIFPVIIFLWLRSHRDIDESYMPPFSISNSDGTNSTTLSLPHRAALSKENLDALERLFSVIQYRSPLPQPDGLVDERGNPVPQSMAEALERVDSANNQVTGLVDSLESYISTRENREENAQTRLNIEPDFREVNEVNRLSDESNE